MDTETTIAKNIRIADEKAKYDAACKRLLSEKIILAWIMKQCLEEYKDCDVKEIAETYIEGQPQVAEVAVAPDETKKGSMIQGINNEDVTMTEGIITYDIRFFAIVPASKDLIRLIINVEAQNDFYPGYPIPKRGIYYCSRMISSQYGTEFEESHYEDIKKVYSIWICMNPPKYRENTITRYFVAEENLVGEVKEKKANYDLLSVIMICLGSSKNKDYAGILKLLDVLLSTETSPVEKCQILEEDFQIEMTQTLESEVSLMCNLSKGVEEKGIEKGFQKGIQEGIQKGKAEGIIETGLDFGLSEKDILERLQKKLNVSLPVAEEFLKKYKQEIF